MARTIEEIVAALEEQQSDFVKWRAGQISLADPEQSGTHSVAIGPTHFPCVKGREPPIVQLTSA